MGNWNSKYRPKSFKTFVGREKQTETIKDLLEGDDVPQTWLISGDKGGGKTTLARLIARKLLGVGIKEDIQEHPDFEEINIGADRSIEKMRSLIERLSFKPKKAKYKVVLLDEVHQLQSAAGSAILKPTEEPPSYVIFIMATTEPYKILPTLKDRAKHIHLAPLEKEDIKKIITRIAEKEELDFLTDKILDKIAETFTGQTRRAIDTINTLSVYKGKKISSDDITKAIEKNSIFDVQVACAILTNIYQGNFSEACQQSLLVEDFHYLINSLLDLNNFLLQKATRVDTYLSPPRRTLLKAIMKVKGANVVKFMKVQEILFELKRQSTVYNMLDPKQLVLFYITKMSLEVRTEKKEEEDE